MPEKIGGNRPLRGCEVCGGVDDHPREATLLPAGDPRAVISDDVLAKLLANGISAPMLKELQDPAAVVRHLDCCRDAGCPTGKCNHVLQGWDGKTGKGMHAHLQSIGAK